MSLMRSCVIAVLFLAAAAAAGCQDANRQKLEADRAQAVQSLQPVVMTRTGGIAGANDRVTIAPDGAIEFRERGMTPATGTLSEFQRLQLVRIFDDFKRLDDRYAPTRPVPDAITTTIKYGDRAVTVVDGAQNVPPEFVTARDRIQEIARGLNSRR
jgi:hypothetical protein